MSVDFKVVNSKILNDVKIIYPSSFYDERGCIWSSYHQDNLRTLLPDNTKFKHDKFSNSKFNILRGIHGDYKSWKLVSCISGSIMQVVVDMRESSKTYLKWESFDLNEKNKSLILIPPGLGNAFYVKSEFAIYHYKLAYLGKYLDADEQFTVSWNDKRLNITWPTNNPILSERDRTA